MLGEQVAEFRGKVTGQRVLPPEGSVPKFETTVEHSGTVLGVASTFTATFWSVIRPDGKIYGENPRQGVLMTEDGEMALFSGTGLGGFTGRGSASKLRGAVYWGVGAIAARGGGPTPFFLRPAKEKGVWG